MTLLTVADPNRVSQFLEVTKREGNGNPLQYSCLGNPMDEGAWQAAVHGVAKVEYNLVTKRQQIDM